MEEWIAPVLTALSCSLLLLLPIALRGKNQIPTLRDEAWRDRLPISLRVLQPAVRWYAASVERSLATPTRNVLQSHIDSAGAAYMITPSEFVVIRRLTLAVGGGLTVLSLAIFGLREPLHLLIAGCLVPFWYFYPDLRLREAATKRRARFEKDFPFFLEVLVLCMKGGLTLTMAVEQAVEQSRAGPVREEFSRFLREVRTGTTRRAAFDRLAARVMTPAATSFVAAVTQAEETGGALSEVLADQARQRRQERFLRAEKLANQAPVKMLFPLIALLFPVTFIVIGFPIVVQLVESGAIELIKSR